MCEPVGIMEIAERLAVAPGTVSMWVQRDLMPAAAWTVGGRKAWDWAAVEQWATATGRLKDGEPPTVRLPRPGTLEYDRVARMVADACVQAGGWASITEAAEAIGRGHHATRRLLDRAVDLGLLTRSVNRGQAAGYQSAGMVAVTAESLT